jgi:hypothetical protein
MLEAFVTMLHFRHEVVFVSVAICESKKKRYREHVMMINR